MSRDAPRALIVGCGALARELIALTRDLPNVDVTCLPASLHNTPGGIPEAVRQRIRDRRAGYDSVFVAYADCGTGGVLDRVIEEEGVERLPGATCYDLFAREEVREAMAEEPGTYFLTDFLVRTFDRLVWRGLGLDAHPELLSTYFGNYRRVVYLAQTEDAGLREAAEAAAQRLGLAFEYRLTGLGHLASALTLSRTHARGARRPTVGPEELSAVGVSRDWQTNSGRAGGATAEPSRAPRALPPNGNARAGVAA